MNPETKPQSLLTFRIGPVLCCAPSLPVRSIITPPKLTRVAGSDASQPGIFRYDSRIIKVHDLRKKFGIEDAEQTRPGNLIITFCEKENFAFWVDQILDVFDFPTEGWGNIPAAIPRGIFTRTLLLNNKIHLYSEFEQLATLKELGYLKHYIQHITQEENKTIAPEEIKKINDTSAVIKKETPVKVESKTSHSISRAKPLTTNDNQTIIEQTKTKQIPLSATIKPTPVKTKSVEIKETSSQKTATRQKPAQARTEVLRSSTQPKPISRIEANKINHAHVNTQVKPVNNKEEKKPAATQTPHNSDARQTDNDDIETSSFGIILFFLLLLGTIVGGSYYLFSDSKTHNYNDKKEPYVGYSKPEYKPDIKSHSDFAKIEQDEINTSTEKTHTRPDVFSFPKRVDEEKPDTVTSEITPVENAEYRADITQHDDEITITVHQPDIEEPQPQPQAVAQVIKTEQLTKAVSIKVLKQDELNITIPTKKIYSEVIHIVVKGDTLWAIAKKYVNNPFLYPELARLSNIKNPHRIYPGNRVRIRFIKN